MNQYALIEYFFTFKALYVSNTIGGSPYVRFKMGDFLQETLDKLPIEGDYFRSKIYAYCSELSQINCTIYKHQNITG